MALTSQLLILIMQLLSSQQVDVNTITIEHQFSIKVPTHFVEQVAEERGAVLEYADYKAGLTVAVYAEERREADAEHPTLEKQWEENRDTFSANLTGLNPGFGTTKVINDSDGCLGDFSGTFRGEKLHYDLLLVETQDHLYKVLVWGKEKDARENAPVAQLILHSFTVLFDE